MNSQFDKLSEILLHYQGDPNWLIECFAVIFNESAATIVEYEKEVKQLYKEIAKLKHTVYKRVKLKKSGPSVSSVQRVPTISKSVVPEAENEPAVAGFHVYPNPFRVLDHEIQLAGEGASVENDSDMEEVIPLLDPQRQKSECNVSSLGHEQDINAGRLPTDSTSIFNQPMGTEIRNVQAP